MAIGLGSRVLLRIILVGLFLLAPWLVYRSLYASEQYENSCELGPSAPPPKAQVDPASECDTRSIDRQAIDRGPFARRSLGCARRLNNERTAYLPRNGDKLFLQLRT
jgi:hypothetical protein